MPLPHHAFLTRPIFGSVALWLCPPILPATLLAEAAAPLSAMTLSAAQPESAPAATHRIRELRAEIARHNALYFQQAAPEISDAQYDGLKRELARLEHNFPNEAASLAPLPEIGDDRTPGFASHPHGEAMLSLAKSYTEEELRTFLRRIGERLGRSDLDYVVEPKFDGLAISVTYEKGELIRAVTRGNGQVGDDVTANVLAIKSIPHRLRAKTTAGESNPVPELIELRGEIYLGNARFQELNRELVAAGETPFSHPRNAASGALKQHDPAEVARRRLEAVFYSWGAVNPASALPATQGDFHRLVRAWGLPAIGTGEVIRATGFDQVWNAVQAIGGMRSRLAFPTDGAVVKLNSIALQRELGATDSAPRWAVAYKFPAARAETILRAITLQVGRSGALTPVAELAPVPLAGSSISRASIYNRDEIARRDLRIGDTVILEKAGEIVPAIVGVNLARRPVGSIPFAFPLQCPACGTSVVEESAGAILRCPNVDCPAQIQRRLEHFASKDAAAIAGLGPATLEILVAKGWVKEIPDLYRLRREQLLTLGKSVDRSTDRLLAVIAASKRTDLWRVVHGLGIPRVGAANAREVARIFGSLAALAAATPETLALRRGELQSVFGPATAEAIVVYLGAPKNQRLLADLISLGVEPTPPPSPTKGR